MGSTGKTGEKWMFHGPEMRDRELRNKIEMGDHGYQSRVPSGYQTPITDSYQRHVPGGIQNHSKDKPAIFGLIFALAIAAIAALTWIVKFWGGGG